MLLSTTTTATTTTTDRVDLIEGARPDVICVDSPAGGAGALLWWALSGSIEYARLRNAWVAAGLPDDDCPEQPSEALALRLAIQSQAHGGRLARRHDGGWVVAEEGRDEDGAWHAREVLRARIDDRSAPAGRMPLVVEGEERLAAIVRAHYEAALVDWPSTSVSSWLPRYVVSRCDGVMMRESGGIYYVPPPAVPALQAIRTVLHTISGHRLILVQALRTSDAIEAILSALCTDTDAAIEEALREATTPRTARHRVGVVQALRERLLRYEALLGERHAALGERIDASERTLALRALADGAAE